MARDERAGVWGGPAGVVYRYAPSRGGAHGEKLLEGFSGTVQVDGYSGYHRLRRSERPGGPLTLAACWVHARRGLKEMFDSNASPIAKAVWSASPSSMRSRRKSGAKRRRRARRCDGRIGTAGHPLRRVARRAALAGLTALASGREADLHCQQWDGLLVFLYDGRVEMDSNFVENRIRPVKLTAKNALFAGHDEGATTWARISSLIETCKMNSVEPYAWLKSTLEKIAAGHPQSRIHELLPWNFDPASN